jgi:hypothetical protein
VSHVIRSFIEKGLALVLDVSFREDDSRVRKDQGPENHALIRRLAASLLKNEPTAQGGVASERKEGGWDNDYRSASSGPASPSPFPGGNPWSEPPGWFGRESQSE